MSSLIRLSPHQQTTYRELWYYAIEHQFTNALIDWLQEQFACVDFGRLRESYCERIPPRIFYNLEHCHIRCDAWCVSFSFGPEIEWVYYMYNAIIPNVA